MLPLAKVVLLIAAAGSQRYFRGLSEVLQSYDAQHTTSGPNEGYVSSMLATRFQPPVSIAPTFCDCPDCITEIAIPPGKVTTLSCADAFPQGCDATDVYLKSHSGGRFKVTTYWSAARADMFPSLSSGNAFVDCFSPGHTDLSSDSAGLVSAEARPVIDVECEVGTQSTGVCTIVSGTKWSANEEEDEVGGDGAIEEEDEIVATQLAVPSAPPHDSGSNSTMQAASASSGSGFPGSVERLWHRMTKVERLATSIGASVLGFLLVLAAFVSARRRRRRAGAATTRTWGQGRGDDRQPPVVPCPDTSAFNPMDGSRGARGSSGGAGAMAAGNSNRSSSSSRGSSAMPSVFAGSNVGRGSSTELLMRDSAIATLASRTPNPVCSDDDL